MKSGESKEKESVKPKVLKPWQNAECIGSEGTVLGARLGLGLCSALKLPSFKVCPFHIIHTSVYINNAPVYRKSWPLYF